MRYVVTRLIHSVVLLAGASVLTFVFLRLAPGDFFADLRLNPQVSAQTVTTLRAQAGLDQPLPVMYARWLRSVLKGNLGFSLAYNTPVAPLLWERAQNTLLLAGVATLLAWLIAIMAGVGSAARQGRITDRLIGGATSLLLAAPELLLALGLLALAVRTGRFPTGGMVSLGFAGLSVTGKIKDIAVHAALPVTALVLGILPVLVRHVRASVLEALQAPFIQAARAHGIPRRRLLFGYALPAAANPLVSLFGLSVAALLSGSLLVEVVMSWPGMGPLLLEAILARDLYVVIGAVMFSTVFLVAGNLAADALLYAVDPRIRAR
ncbi:MAG: ABC transporter permease [Terriglobia bacterium]